MKVLSLNSVEKSEKIISKKKWQKLSAIKEAHGGKFWKVLIEFLGSELLRVGRKSGCCENVRICCEQASLNTNNTYNSILIYIYIYIYIWNISCFKENQVPKLQEMKYN